MTLSENILSALSQMYFFEEFVQDNLVFVDKKGNEEELADLLLNLGDVVIAIQIKEREEANRTKDLLSFLLPMGEKGFVVSQKDPEKPLTLTAFRCMMKRINASVDLHGATSHVFRHTIGTMLNDTGADVKTIQSILGQSDFKTTMDRYVHPRDSKKQEAIKNVSLLLHN